MAFPRLQPRSASVRSRIAERRYSLAASCESAGLRGRTSSIQRVVGPLGCAARPAPRFPVRPQSLGPGRPRPGRTRRSAPTYRPRAMPVLGEHSGELLCGVGAGALGISSRKPTGWPLPGGVRRERDTTRCAWSSSLFCVSSRARPPSPQATPGCRTARQDLLSTMPSALEASALGAGAAAGTTAQLAATRRHGPRRMRYGGYIGRGPSQSPSPARSVGSPGRTPWPAKAGRERRDRFGGGGPRGVGPRRTRPVRGDNPAEVRQEPATGGADKVDPATERVDGARRHGSDSGLRAAAAE